MSEEKMNDLQNQQLRDLWDTAVPWKVFLLVLGLITTVLGWMISQDQKLDMKLEAAQTSLNSKIETTQNSFADMKAQLMQIQTDIKWIKDGIDKLSKTNP